MIKTPKASFLAAGSLAGLLTLGLAGPVAAADEIFAAQNALYGAGYDIGTADGQMGPSTRSALEQFQQDHSDLQVTGELNDNTREALGLVTTEVAAASSSSGNASQSAASTSSSSASASASSADTADETDSAGSNESEEGDVEEEDDGSWSFF